MDSGFPDPLGQFVWSTWASYMFETRFAKIHWKNGGKTLGMVAQLFNRKRPQEAR